MQQPTSRVKVAVAQPPAELLRGLGLLAGALSALLLLVIL